MSAPHRHRSPAIEVADLQERPRRSMRSIRTGAMASRTSASGATGSEHRRCVNGKPYVKPADPDDQQQAAEPFPLNGDQHGAVSGSPAAPGLPGNANASAEGQAPGNATIAPVEARCKCGAEPHATESGICARGHTMPGNTRTLKHGLYAEQAAGVEAADGIDAASATQRQQLLRRLFDAIGRDVSRYADPGRTHRLNARDQAHVLNMLDRLRDIDERLKTMDAAAPCETTDGEELPADWPRRLARHFANQPDQFGEFVMKLLTADRDRCGPLRSQVRLTLDYLEPQGVPRWRGKKADEDDEVVLL